MKVGDFRVPRASGPARGAAPAERTPQDSLAASGLGVPCAEAQADGVPCGELGIECHECQRGPRADAHAAHAEDRRA